jgi:hypothetical protein
LKAYHYYSALHIEDVRLALSEINGIKICSKAMDALNFGSYIACRYLLEVERAFVNIK